MSSTVQPPRISVFVITYNHERFIAEALNGIVMQRLDCSMELIIGEDCSTDGTYAVCQEFAEKYPSLIRLLPSERNLKMMGNFYRTLRECKGEFIAFCEGDDYWSDPYKLQKQLKMMEATPQVVFTFHGCRTFDESTRTFGTYYKHTGFREGIIEKGALFEKGGGAFGSPSIMFRRSILTYPDWFMEAPTGDFPLLLLAIVAGEIGYLEEEMCVVRLNTGVSWSESFRSFEAYEEYFVKEDAYIRRFNESSHYKFNRMIGEFNQLRVYRLILQFYKFDKSLSSRLRFLFDRADRLDLKYKLKSLLRLIIPVGVNGTH